MAIILFFSSLFAKVICFEANPSTFELLKFNSRYAPNLELYNFGISDEVGIFEMYSFPNNIGGATVRVEESLIPRGADCVMVGLEKLDEMKGLENIGLIKIDVEGLETRVIRGAQNLIQRERPIIFFESIVSISEQIEPEIFSTLRDFGYLEFWAFQKSPISRFRNPNLRFVFSFILRMILGEKHSILPIKDFRQSFSFVIAVP